MIDISWAVSEYLDIPDTELDSMTAAELRFIWRLTAAYNEYTRLTMPDPVTADSIMRDCLRSLSPRSLH